MHARLEIAGKWDLFQKDKKLCSCIYTVRTKLPYGVSPVRKVRSQGNIRRSEELFQHDIHAPEHLSEEEIVAGFIHHALTLVESFRSGKSVS